MQAKHSWVSLVDLPEAFTFTVAMSEDATFQEQMSAQEKAEKALFDFMDEISKEFKEEIYFLGQDVIGEKFFYRFQCEKQGFIEVMNQAPSSLIGHFLDDKKAQKFKDALIKSLPKGIRKDRASLIQMLYDNIELSQYNKESSGFKVDTHTKMARIREDIDKF